MIEPESDDLMTLSRDDSLCRVLEHRKECLLRKSKNDKVEQLFRCKQYISRNAILSLNFCSNYNRDLTNREMVYNFSFWEASWMWCSKDAINRFFYSSESPTSFYVMANFFLLHCSVEQKWRQMYFHTSSLRSKLRI